MVRRGFVASKRRDRELSTDLGSRDRSVLLAEIDACMPGVDCRRPRATATRERRSPVGPSLALTYIRYGTSSVAGPASASEHHDARRTGRRRVIECGGRACDGISCRSIAPRILDRELSRYLGRLLRAHQRARKIDGSVGASRCNRTPSRLTSAACACYAAGTIGGDPMPDLLLELFSEEIPARMQARGGGGSEEARHRPAGRCRPRL